MESRIPESGISTIALILGVAVFALVAGFVVLSGTSDEQAAVTSQTVAENVSDEDSDSSQEMVVEEPDSMAETEEEMIVGEMVDDMIVTTSNRPGTFEDYSPEKLALASDGRVILFFHADWCPSCRALASDINESLSEIPANTHILKVDYDSATELKRQYGVVRQHTLVHVDANGNEIKKLNGLTNTLEQVIEQL